MEKHKVKVNNVITHIRELNYTERLTNHVCPICRKPVKQGKAYLLINNYKLFPNIIIHNWCVARIPIVDQIPKKDWEFTILSLKADFERAEKEREQNRCWFGDD